MATVFSTATLGLNVDNTQLKKELKSTQGTFDGALRGMEIRAAAFTDRWGDLTRGIKDTKRIISGILVSQGFYALSNALVGAGAAALEFSRNMETAAVSLEYFVDAAEGTETAAAQVAAYLREVNTFAARTPFSTSDVLTLSKYMQAVGVAMGQTQSVLSVITDAAAATGATTENLQRITFALGQMITKGRIANEEIRQLANANVPIYQILQEELHLTGEQISNIGNYWIDANDAVVAILNGLNKRYQGAADRIAETLTGLTDTIVDDAKIIADSAFAGIYDSIVDTAGTLRDTLDYWREVVTEQGSMGLFNTILTDIDPTGQFGNQVLTLVGNVRQLIQSFNELKVAAAPVASIFGTTFYSSINIALIALTGLSDVSTQLLDVLDELGISTGVVGKSIASLFIAYKATKFVSLLGQAMGAAGINAVTLANNIFAILPASIAAHRGLAMLSAGLAGVLLYGLAVAGIFKSLNNSFAGLETSDTGFAPDYQTEYDRYAAAMEEYNEKIAQYQEQFRDPYTDMSSGNPIVSEEEDDDDSNNKSGTINDWVASFDEVYSIPEDSGDYEDEVLADLGALLAAIHDFEFPTLDNLTLDMPEFDWDAVYDGSLWDGLGDEYAGQNFWKSFLPVALTGAVFGIGKAFAKQNKEASKIINETLGNGKKGTTSGLDDAFKGAQEAARDYAKQANELASKTTQLEKSVQELREELHNVRSVEGGVNATDRLSAKTTVLEDQIKSIRKILTEANGNAAIANKTLLRVNGLAEAEQLVSNAKLTAIENSLKRLRTLAAKNQGTAAEQLALTNEIKQLERQQRQLLSKNLTPEMSGLTVDELKQQFNVLAEKVVDGFNKAFPEHLEKLAPSRRIYPATELKQLASDFAEFKKVATVLEELFGEIPGELDSIGGKVLTALEALDKDVGGKLGIIVEGVDGYNRAVQLFVDAAKANVGVGTYAVSEETNKALIGAYDSLKTLQGYIKSLNLGELDKLVAERVKQAEISEARRTAAELADQEANKAAIKQRAQAEKTRRGIQRTADEINAKQNFPNLFNDALLKIDADSVEDIAGALVPRQQELVDRLTTLDEDIIDANENIGLYTKQLQKLGGEAASGAGATEAREGLATYTEYLKNATAQRAEIVEELKTLQSGQPRTLTSRIPTRPVAPGSAEAYSAIEAALKAYLPSLEGVAQSTHDALQAFNDALSPKTIAALKRLGLDADVLLLTGTKALYAAQGLDAFGGTLQHTVAEILAASGNFARQMTDTTTEYLADLADRGVVMEKYFGAASAVTLNADNVTVYDSGHAMRPGTQTIIQYDFAVEGLDKVIADASHLMSFDIKTSNARLTDTLNANSTEIVDGIRRLDVHVLEQAGREKWAYQFAAQDYAFGSGGKMMLGLANADFDFTEVVGEPAIEKLWRRIFTVANNSAVSDARRTELGGRFLSEDFFNEFRKLMNRDVSWEDYDRLVIAPTLADKTSGISFTDFDKALTRYIVDIPESFRAALNLPRLEKLYSNYVEMFALVANNPQVEKFLTGFIEISDGAEQFFGAVDFAPALRNYYKMTRSANKWAQNILGVTDVKFKPGATSKQLQSMVDKLVLDYTNAIASGVEHGAADAAFSTTIKQLDDAALALISGGDVTDDLVELFGKMAAAPEKYYEDLQLFRSVLDRLSEAPNLINKVPRLVTSTMSQMNRLVNAAQLGLEVTSRDMSNMVSTYENMVQTLRLSSNKVAIETGHELAAIQRFISNAGGTATLTPEQVAKLISPINYAGVEDTLRLSAAAIQQGLKDGTLRLGKVAGARFEELISSMDLPSIAEDYFTLIQGRLKEYARTVVADLETTGMPVTNEFGTRQPYITQAHFEDINTGEQVSRYISYGHEQNVRNLAAMQNILNRDGTLSDVAKAWRSVTVDQLDAGVTLDELWKQLESTFGKGNALTGWNAVGPSGFDYQVMLGSGMPADLFEPVDDYMTRFSNLVQRTTGVSKRFKLSDAFEILYGELEDVAHLADADVTMVRRIAEAIDNGSAEQILSYAGNIQNLTSGNVTDVLKQAGNAFRELNAPARPMRPGVAAGRPATNLPEYVYHITNENNLDSILKSGLNADSFFSIGDLSSTEGLRSILGASSFTDAAGEPLEGLTLLRIKTSELGDTMRVIGDQFTDVVPPSAIESVGNLKEAVRQTGFAIDDIFPAADSVSDGVKAGAAVAEEAAETAGKASATFGNAFKDAAGRFTTDMEGALDSLRVRFASWRDALKDGPFGFAGNAARTLNIPSIDDALKQLRTAAMAADDVYAQMAEAFRTGGPAAADEIAKSAEDILKAYETAGNNMYRSIINSMGKSLKEADASADLYDFVSNLNRNNDYIALVYDKASRSFKSLGDTLKMSGDELYLKLASMVTNNKANAEALDQAIEQLAKAVDPADITKALGNMEVAFKGSTLSASKELTDSFDDVLKIFRRGGSIEELREAAANFGKSFGAAASDSTSELGKALDDFVKMMRKGKATPEALAAFTEALNKQVGNSLIVTNAASEKVEFAGKAAANAMGSAADELAGGMASMAKKVLRASYGTFSVLDVVGVGIDLGIEAYQNSLMQESFGTMVNAMVSADTRSMFESAGLDLKDALGDSVYKGISEALQQSIIITLFANGLGTAAAAAAGAVLASGPVGWVGALVAAGVGLGTRAIVNSTGGDTDAYKYFNEYAEAVKSGEFIDYAALVESLTSAGYSLEEATKAADEANEVAHRQLQNRIMWDMDSSNIWEAGNVSEVLHGTMPTVNSTDNDPLRIAAALGALDIASQYRSVDYGQGAVMHYNDLLVRDENAAEELEKIKEVLGRQDLILGAAVERNGETYREVQYASGGAVQYNSGNLELLKDAIDMAGSQGYSTGSVVSSIMDTINGNEALAASYDELYGNMREAQNILSDFLKVYNEANGTSYTASYLDSTGMSNVFVQQMIDAYEAQSAAWYNEMQTRTTTDSTNRNILAGDTSSMIVGSGYNQLTTEILEDLAASGLSLTGGSYSFDTAYGPQTQEYAVLETNADLLRENLAGMTIDMSGVFVDGLDGRTIDVASLNVSAEDAAILAQAGIQINGDGTITFMNALNEGSTGAERDLTLGEGSFSQNVIKGLDTYGMELDFDNNALNLTDYDALGENMSAALFSMPSNINNKLSDEMLGVIAQIGEVTDSGYLQITNSAILNGSKTIREFIESAGVAVDALSPDVYNSLMTIDALIQKGGGDIQANILEWASSIVVPSPISADQLTPEIEAAFSQVGITFAEGANGLMMVINQTGELLNNGVSLISKDKWDELDDSIKNALVGPDGIGVTATECGNDMLIDLNGVFDNGIGDIVSLFINNPETWDQIPEQFRAILESSGLISHDKLLEIKQRIDGGLVEITDGWITSWDKLPKELADDMADAGINTTEGMMQITKCVDDAKIGDVVDGGIVVPFDELPEELKEAMGASATELEGTNVILKDATDKAVGDMLAVLAASVTTAGQYGTELGTTIGNAVTNALLQIQRLEQMQANAGRSGFLWSSKNNVTMVTGSDGKIYYPEYNNKGEVVRYGYYDEKGLPQYTKSVPGLASGGYASGYTLTGELGPEMAILPNGTVQWVTSGVYDLPEGTQIINAEDSAAVAKYAGRVSSIEKLADGNTALSVDKKVLQDEEMQEFFMQLSAVLDVSLRAAEEIESTAIHGAKAAIIEELSGANRQNTETLNTNLSKRAENIQNSIESAATKNTNAISSTTSSITSAISALQSSLSSAISNLAGSMSSMGSNLSSSLSSLTNKVNSIESSAASSASSSKDSASSLDLSVDYAQQAIDAAKNNDWEAVADALDKRTQKIEMIGTNYGITNDDIMGTITKNTGKTTVKANAYGGLVSNDSLVRVGEYGKSEAILPLEQPSVMAQLGSTIAAYTGVNALTPDELQSILQVELMNITEILATAVHGAVAALTESDEGQTDILNTNITRKAENITNGLDSATNKLDSSIDGAASTISSAISSMQSSLSSAISSLAGSMSSMGSNLGSNLAAIVGNAGTSSGSGSGSGSSSGSTSIDLSVDYSQMAIDAAKNNDWAAVADALDKRSQKVSIIGTDYGKSNADILNTIKNTKGSASGSLITEDALYRAGELGLNEAIIPLERPDVLEKVGQAIASFMPVDLASGLRYAVGLENGGIQTSFSSKGASSQQDMMQVASTMAQRMLEAILPQIVQSQGDDGESKRPLYVGTLIADDRGLKQLERKLYTIRQSEDARRQ